MKKQISYKIVSLVFSVLVVCFAIAFYVIAWEEPTDSPPGGYIPAPLNTGVGGQSKEGGLLIHNSSSFEDPSKPYGLLVRYGYVGIGTTEPQAKLHIDGIAGTDGIMFPDGTLQTTAATGGAGAGAFGDWTNKDSDNNTLVKDAVYQATSDGFVTAAGLVPSSGPMYIRTDSNPSPSTIRCKQSGFNTKDPDKAASCFTPVKKDDYWKVSHNAAATIYWIPIGSGVCEKQP